MSQTKSSEWKYPPCQCYKRIHHHIPVNALASIIYDYVREDHIPRSSLNFETTFGSVNIRARHISFSRYNEYIITWVDKKTHVLHRCKWRNCTRAYSEQYLSNNFNYQNWNKSFNQGNIVHCESNLPITGNATKGRFTAIIKIAFCILYAEETGGHFHPDQKI